MSMSLSLGRPRLLTTTPRPSDAGILFAALAVAALVFTPQPAPPGPVVSADLGADFATALYAAPGDLAPWVQLAGNVLLLLPLAVLVPLRIGWFDRASRVALGGLGVSLGIELVQLVVVSGRVSSVDDLVLNTAGAALGGLLLRGSGVVSGVVRWVLFPFIPVIDTCTLRVHDGSYTNTRRNTMNAEQFAAQARAELPKPGTAVENLLHTVAAYKDTPDSKMLLEATSGIFKDRTGLTMGDLRELAKKLR